MPNQTQDIQNKQQPGQQKQQPGQQKEIKEQPQSPGKKQAGERDAE